MSATSEESVEPTGPVPADESPPTLKPILFYVKQCIAGVRDAITPRNVIKLLSQSKEVRNRLLDILIFNGICFITLWTFQHLIRPSISDIFAHTQAYPSNWSSTLDNGPFKVTNASMLFALGFLSAVVEYGLVFLYYVSWIIPVFALSFFINGKWLQKISERGLYLLLKKPPSSSSLTRLSQLPNILAAEVFTTTFYGMFILQSCVIHMIPVFGPIVNLIFLSWLYSLYCFEFKWSNWHIGVRLKYIEDNWAYFVGFGLMVGIPFTLAEHFFGFWISYTVWWLLYPLFIINAIGAGDPPDSINKGGKVKLALFQVAKWLNMFLLNLAVSLLKLWVPSK